MRIKVAAIGLALGLAVQLAVFFRPKATFDDLSGPLPGTPFPELAVLRLGDTTPRPLHSVPVPSSCALVVFMDTECTFCRRLRYSWSQGFAKWADSVGHVDAIWVFANDTSAVRHFIAGYQIAPVTPVVAADAQTAITRFGVIGTPVAYLIDGRSRTRIGIAGGGLPPVQAARRACSGDK